MKKIGDWCLFLGFACLGILIVLLGLADLDAKEVIKDTRIISQGKSFMTDFKTCILVCKEFDKKNIACKCDVYTEEQMKYFKVVK